MKKLSLLLVWLCLSCIEHDPNYIPPPHQDSEVFTRGKRQLQIQGYQNIQEIEYPFFCCDKNDSWASTGFQATDKEGNTITGCFCTKSIFTSSITIRFE